MEQERRVAQRRVKDWEPGQEVPHPDRRSGVERRVANATATGVALSETSGDIDTATKVLNETAAANAAMATDGPVGDESKADNAAGPAPAAAPDEPRQPAKFPMMGEHNPEIETAGKTAFRERRMLKRRSTDTW